MWRTPWKIWAGHVVQPHKTQGVKGDQRPILVNPKVENLEFCHALKGENRPSLNFCTP
jgi:hypothetical protein